MFCRAVTQVGDGAGVVVEQESGMYVLVVKTANRVFRFSHQNKDEIVRWLQAFHRISH